MGAIYSLFFKKEERHPVSMGTAIVNAVANSYRGLFAVIIGVIILACLLDFSKPGKVVTGIWLFLFVFLFFTPVPVGACGLIPVFTMSIFGILNSKTCCGGLINENIVLFFIGGWLLLILNNCGMDKRLACYFLAKGGKETNTPTKLLMKSCMAAFCISAIAERELTTQAIMGYVISALEPLQNVKNEANYEEMKNIICNAIAISSSIGSLCVVHSSIITLQMRSLFSQASADTMEFPDVFNYLNYSAYAVPTAILMFILSTSFQAFVLSRHVGKKPISDYNKDVLQKAFKKQQTDLGPMSSHEKVSVAFLIVILLCYFTRWSKWLGMGWGTFRRSHTSPDLCGVKDATTACVFGVLLHFLPKSLSFLKIFSAKKQRDLPEMKVESGILFWKFVDKRTDYSLFFLIGSGTVLYKAMVATKLNEDIAKLCGNAITHLDWNVGILIVVLVSVFLGSIMSGLGSQAVLMPFMLGMAMTGHNKWPQRQYLVALAVGIGSGLGFCVPYHHSPCTFVRSIAKVKAKKQIMYSFMSTILCAVILWLSLCFYAPILWDPHDAGIIAEARPGVVVVVTTTPAAASVSAPAGGVTETEATTAAAAATTAAAPAI